MFTRFFSQTCLASLCCAGLLTACNSNQAVSGPEPEASAVQVQKTDASVPHPDYPGVFIMHNDMFVEIARGSADELKTTNAERGFGFLQPLGEHYSVPITSWTILSKRLNLTTLQISRLEGFVIMPNLWFEAVSHENAAWLPKFTVPTSIKIPNPNEPLAQMTINEPLEPGFYVLHDDSFVRSRKTGEVSAYYPFVVVDSESGLRPWEEEAQRCFELFFSQYENAQFGQTAKDMKALRHCAELQQLIMKMRGAERDEQKITDRLLFLSSIARDTSSDVRAELYKRMDASGSELSTWLWERAHAEIIHRLTEVSRRLKENVPYEEQLRPLYEYYLGTSTPNIRGLRSLLWLPFVALDSSDPQLELLFSSIGDEGVWQPLLVQILGALEVERIQKMAHDHSTISKWLGRVQHDIDASFSEMHRKIKPRSSMATASIGPFTFNNVSAEDANALRQKALSRSKEFTSCYNALERRRGRRDTFLVMEIPLDDHIVGREVHSVLKDPFDVERRLPVVDAEFIHCTRKVFHDLSLPSVFEPSKTMSFVVSVHGQNAAPGVN